MLARKRGPLGFIPYQGPLPSSLFKRELKKWRSWLSEDKILVAKFKNFWPKLNETNVGIPKPYFSKNVTNFLRSICKKKTSFYILKTCREISQRFGERLREGKLVNNLEIFRIRLSLMVSEAIFHLGLLDLHNSTHHTQPRSIIASYLNSTTFI